MAAIYTYNVCDATIRTHTCTARGRTHGREEIHKPCTHINHSQFARVHACVCDLNGWVYMRAWVWSNITKYCILYKLWISCTQHATVKYAHACIYHDLHGWASMHDYRPLLHACLCTWMRDSHSTIGWCTRMYSQHQELPMSKLTILYTCAYGIWMCGYSMGICACVVLALSWKCVYSIQLLQFLFACATIAGRLHFHNHNVCE